MLYNIWFEDTNSLINYIDNQSEDKKLVTIICPDPLTADKMRNRFGSGFKVETISAGLKALLNENNFESLEVYRKSELLFELWVAWNKVGLSKSYRLFNNSFNMVTEFRGYSVNTDFIIDLLREKDEELYEGVIFLLRYYKERGLNDENSIYEKLAKENLDFGDRKSIFFYGFKHLSANQIDMLNNFSRTLDIYIPFPKELKSGLSFSDWPQWIRENSEEVNLEEDESDETITLIKSERFLNRKYLNQWASENPKGSIYFWDKAELTKSIHEIDPIGITYKQDATLFDEELARLKKKLTELECHEMDSLLLNLEEMFKLENESENKNYRRLKVLFDFHENIKTFKAFGMEELSQEDLKILFEKTQLDMPRNSFVHNGGEVTMGTFADSVLDIGNEKLFIIEGTVNFDSNQAVDDEVLSELASIGPLRNFDLDLAFTKASINLLNDKEKATLLISPDVFEKTELFNEFNDRVGGEFFSEEVARIPQALSGKELKEEVGRALSPSRLQTYIDCQYKYYLSYLDKLDALREVQSEMLNWEVGTMAHDVLNDVVPIYFNKNEIVPIEDSIADQILEKNKSLEVQYREEEIRQSLELTINKAFLEFQKIPAGLISKAYGEEYLENDLYKGTLDLFLRTETEDYFVFDYKKSNGSIPTKKDFLAGESIQLSLYSNFFDEGTVPLIGYICIEKPEDSMFFYDKDNVEVERLRNSGFYQSSKKWYPISNDEIDLIKNKIDEYRTSLFATEEFIATPRKKDSCTFCQFQDFCVRSV